MARNLAGKQNMKKPKIFGIERRTFFTGKRRVGLDTNILIKLYEQPDMFAEEQARIFNQRDTMFTHAICVWELAKHLMKSKGYEEEQAKAEAKKFVKEKNIERVYTNIPQEEINAFEKSTNERFQKEGKSGLHCHKPDSIILLGFKRIGVNKIISDDGSFREAARCLGIDSERIPSLNHKISKQLRELFGKRKKRY